MTAQKPVPRAVVPEGEVPWCFRTDGPRPDATSRFLSRALGDPAIDWKSVLYLAWARLSVDEREDFLGHIDQTMAYGGSRWDRWRAIRERRAARQRAYFQDEP
jgi:hypothetical protein